MNTTTAAQPQPEQCACEICSDAATGKQRTALGGVEVSDQKTGEPNICEAGKNVSTAVNTKNELPEFSDDPLQAGFGDAPARSYDTLKIFYTQTF